MTEAAELYEVEAEIVDDTPSVAALEPATTGSALVRPAGDVETVVGAFEDYQRICAALLADDDFQSIQGKKFRKRSAWRKLAVAFGVTFEIVERTIDRDGPRVAYAEFVVRAVAPNGRFADGWGACDVLERCCPPDCSRQHRHCPSAQGDDCPGWPHFSHANHDIPATAETRAKNRAAADLFGMGEVSAEEITDLDTRREHDEALAELAALLDTAEAAGVEGDRAKAEKYARLSLQHARKAIETVRGRLADTTPPDEPVGEDPEPEPCDICGATDDTHDQAAHDAAEQAMARDDSEPDGPLDRRPPPVRAADLGVSSAKLLHIGRAVAQGLDVIEPTRGKYIVDGKVHPDVLAGVHERLDELAADQEREAQS